MSELNYKNTQTNKKEQNNERTVTQIPKNLPIFLQSNAANDIYPQSIITIKKGGKNSGLINFQKEKISQEFYYLKQNIDNDKAHEARLMPNINLNRYSNIRPYQDNIVRINSKNKYINASWVHLPEKYYFIATQGPLDTTIEDFWEMIFGYNVNVIVMLCQLQENNRVKCADYWDSQKVQNYKLTKLSEFEMIEGIILRNFEINKPGYIFPKTTIQLHYTCWEDHSVPDEQSYLKLVELIKMTHFLKVANTPVVVHCSAGVGRTGTFISLYNLYYGIPKQLQNNYSNVIRFSVMDLVRKLKEMRLRLVENEKQYQFIYQFLNIFLWENN